MANLVLFQANLLRLSILNLSHETNKEIHKVDNDICFRFVFRYIRAANENIFFAKNMRLSIYTLFCKKLNFSDNHNNHEVIIDLSMVACPLYGALPPLRPSIHSMASCFLNSPLSPRQPSVLSTALCLLYSHMSTLHPYLLSMAFCSLFSPLFPL
jgi:hypothetical protein